MTPDIRAWVERCAGALPDSGPVIEVGSLWVEGGGGQALADMRPLFPGRPYLGVDVRGGPGVDMEADGEALPLPDEAFGLALCLDTVEHVKHPWRAYNELWRVLRPGGWLLTSTVFMCGIHAHPQDYWRCTAEGMAVWLEDFAAVWTGSGGHGPKMIVGIACKGAAEVPEGCKAGWS